MKARILDDDDEVPLTPEAFEVEAGVGVMIIVMTMVGSNPGPETMRILKKCERNPDREVNPKGDGVVEVEVVAEVEIVILVYNS